YNNVEGELPIGGQTYDVTVDRWQLGGGWFVTPTILLKGEYARQRYFDFPAADIRHGGKFSGFVFEGVVSFCSPGTRIARAGGPETGHPRGAFWEGTSGLACAEPRHGGQHALGVALSRRREQRRLRLADRGQHLVRRAAQQRGAHVRLVREARELGEQGEVRALVAGEDEDEDGAGLAVQRAEIHGRERAADGDQVVLLQQPLARAWGVRERDAVRDRRAAQAFALEQAREEQLA